MSQHWIYFVESVALVVFLAWNVSVIRHCLKRKPTLLLRWSALLLLSTTVAGVAFTTYAFAEAGQVVEAILLPFVSVALGVATFPLAGAFLHFVARRLPAAGEE